MEPQLEKIREVQKEAWNKSSVGWKKWDAMVMEFLEPMNSEIIRMLNLKDDHMVLDIATGTGEPGLSIATLLKSGKVVGTDLSEEMLIVAKEKASNRNLKNFEAVWCDVSDLPFENEKFDSICCRLGFMFFPDIQLALKEMLRVLKPGGRIAVSVWGIPEENSWICTSMETMISRLGLKQPAPGAPGLFRCSEPGFISKHFKQAGFNNIDEKTLEGKLKCNDIDTYWNFISEVASPMAFSKADDSLKQEIKNEVLDKVRQKNAGEKIELNSFSIIIAGEK